MIVEEAGCGPCGRAVVHDMTGSVLVSGELEKQCEVLPSASASSYRIPLVSSAVSQYVLLKGIRDQSKLKVALIAAVRRRHVSR